MTRGEVNSYLKKELGYTGSGTIDYPTYEKDGGGLLNKNAGVIPIKITDILFDYKGKLYQATLKYSMANFPLYENNGAIEIDEGAHDAFEKTLKEKLNVSNIQRSGSMLTFTVRDEELYNKHVDYLKQKIERLTKIN